MSGKPNWSDAALGERLTRAVQIAVPPGVAAALARYCEQRVTGSVVVEFHFADGKLRKVKRSECAEESVAA